MKIGISSTGTSLDDMIDSRFGRTARFIVFDTDSKNIEIVDNVQNLNAAQGAGIQAAQNIARCGVSAVITGHTGPKAFKVLNESKIEIYHAEEISAKEALSLLEAGKLRRAEAADVEGHW